MGEVLRARDNRLGREVAIKVLPAQFASDADRLRRFEQEARATAALNHPNLLAIYDIGSQGDGSPYIVSELLVGDTLRDRLRSGALPMRKAIDYAAQIALGLAAAHSKGIVHRDLKPENIYITTDGRTKILDFGLAKLSESAAQGSQTIAATRGVTTPGMVLGTVGYMSPEQVRGHEADHRSDIFSFGAVLYEMFSGKRAFVGATPADTISSILKDDPPDLSETNRAVSPAIDRIVRHCLEKNPEERFQSASDVAFGLEALSGVSSSPSGAIAAAPASSPRSRRRAVFAAVGSAGLLVASAISWWLGMRTLRPEFPSYKPITFRRGSIGNARFGSDGQTVIYSASWEGAPTEVYTGRTDSLGDRSTGMSGAEVLSISSAGEIAIRTNTRFMGGFERSGLLSVVPTAGGAPRAILDGVEDVDWSADGKQMAIVRYIADKQFWRLEYPAGKVLSEGANWISGPRVSRDGRRIAFFDHGNSSGDDRGNVAVVDLDGKKTTLSTGYSSLAGLAWSPDGNEVWFSGTTTGNAHSLYAVTLSGKLRPLATMPADVLLQDVRPDGKVLLKKETTHSEIYGGEEGEASERKLDWLDWSRLSGIADDGKYVFFDEEGEGGGPEYTVYVRPTDGGPAIALGHGDAVAMSPDNLWVLTGTLGAPSQFMLVPTGPGEARTLTHDQIDHLNARFLPDGKHLIFTGREPGRRVRTYMLDIESGDSKPITAEGIVARTMSPDGKSLIVRSNGEWCRSAVAGGEPVPIAALKADDIIGGFTADGTHVYVGSPDESRPRKVYLVDLTTGKRILWKSLGPQDWTGAGSPGMPSISRDGKHYAYFVIRSLSDLYVVTGLK
jgi:dipeptidyl aminopeptidase/acylaminoacyl peptidase